MTSAKLGWVPRLGAFAVGIVLVLGTARGQEEKKAAAEKPADPEREALLKLNAVTGDDALTAKLRALIKDKDKAKKTAALAAKMRKEAKGGEKPFNFNASLVIAKVALVAKEYDTAETFFEDCVESSTKLSSGPKMLQAYDGLIDLYWDTKKYSAVVETCEKVLDIRGVKEVADAQIFILERLVQAKSKLGQHDEALKITSGLVEAAEESGQGWYFLQLKAFVQREAGKNDAAIKTHLDVIEKLDTAKGLKDDAARDRLKDTNRYILSGLYVDIKDIDNAAKQLQILIKRNPDKATYKNDLGFIWCDHDMNLEESEKLIREALALDKKDRETLKSEGKLDKVEENAAYLDSLGWVLFKQKKYKEALEYLKKACEDDDDGNHLEIWDHLADCHMAMNQKKEAIAAWEKGLKMEDLSKRDAERRRKVTEKLKKARASEK